MCIRDSPQPGHDLPKLLGHKVHEPLHIFGLARKALAQLGPLGGDAKGTGTQMTDPHHPAAQGHQRRGGEGKLLGAQQQRHRHVVAVHQLAVGLQGDQLP